jgi:phosphoenolpyruvate mutase
MLGELFERAGLAFLMGAHDALSARIAQEAGFEGIWVSGLGLSATSGLRDSNELSWTQVMERIEHIADRVTVPALADIDTGYGDFNNVRLVARKLSRIGIGGACIEDKVFPKTNSFIESGQMLADPAEFCGRIKAAKDTAGDGLFMVARCEALVAGRPLAEAINRCCLYVDSGADAVLIHSKRTEPGEILAFMSEWDGRAPVVIVPTSYATVSDEVFERAGVSVVVWANQSLRAAIVAMQRLCDSLFEQRTMRELDDTIARLSRVFELADNAELDLAKERYQRYVPPGRTAAPVGAVAPALAETPADSANGDHAWPAGTASRPRAGSPIQDVERLHRAWSNRPACPDPVGALIRQLRDEVPFYRGTTAEELTDLPIVDRGRYRDLSSEFRSVRAAPAHTLVSSGSTGEPLTIALDDASWYAVNYHFFAQIGSLARLAPEKFDADRLAVLFVSNKPSRSSFVSPVPSLGYRLYARVQMLPGSDVVGMYSRLRATVLYGKPTYLLDLRAALLAHGIVSPPWCPELILVSGESLHADDRQRLTDYFSAPVVDALASTEGGLIAATPPGGAHHHVFSDNVRLEVITDDGVARAAGVGELVLTNLVYRDTVFARYRTGDRVELDTDADASQYLLRLWGREPRSLRFRQRNVTTDVLTDRVGFLPGLADFQIETGPDRATLRWVGDVDGPDPEEMHRTLRIVLADLLPDEDIRFERRERITPLGGKKRRFL